MQVEPSVAKGAAALYVANVFTLVLNTLFLVLLTNYVSLTEVGLVSLLNVVVVGVATLSVLALPLTGSAVSATPPAVTRFTSQYSTSQGLGRRVYFISLGICAAVSGSIAIALSMPKVAPLIAGPLEMSPVFFAAIDSIVYSFAQLGGYSLLGTGRATSAGKLMMTSSTLRYVIASSLLIAGLGPTGVFIGFAFGDSLMAVWANVSVARAAKHEAGAGGTLRPVFGYMASVFVAALIGFGVSQTDKLLAFFQQGLGNLAIYNVAAVGAAVTSFAPNAATNVLVPALSGYGDSVEKKRETLRTYSRYISLTAAPMGFGLAAVSPFLLRVFGDAYVASAPLLAVISVSIALTAIASVYASSLLVEDRAHHFTISNVLALFCLFAVAVVSVPRLGLMGIAIGRAAMSLAMLALVALFVRRFGMLLLDAGAYWKSLAASILMAVIVYGSLAIAAEFLPLGRAGSVGAAVLMMPVGLSIYLILMKKFRAFDWSDLAFVEGIMPKSMRWLARLFGRLL